MRDDPRYEVNLDVSAGTDRSSPTPLPDDPLRICLIGDFTGRGASGQDDRAPLPDRRPVPVDRDDLDEVLGRFAPRLRFVIEGDTGVELSFTELDDFHPDRLFARAALFQALREARARLESPESFQGTLEAILGGAPADRTTEPAVGTVDVIADTLSDTLLDNVIGGDRGQDSLQGFLRRVVAPHVVPGEDPAREAMLDDLDVSITRGMRAILHHGAFQSLEALWRSVFFLVRRLDTGPSLKLSLLDAAPEALREDGAMAALFQAVGDGQSVLVVDHAFGASDDDLDLLMMLAVIAREKGAAMLAGASPTLIGLEAFEGTPFAAGARGWHDTRWRAFRQSPEARGVGLVLPRFLLRVPYGAESDPCDYLPLEEVDSPPAHAHLLWGGGAVAAAALLGQSFAAAGWRMRLGEHVELSGLPMYSWHGPDGPGLTPCTEGRVTDELAVAALQAGPMVLSPVGHGDGARLVRVQSIASPAAALEGPWSQLG